jgi:hypothetical protein
MIIKTSKRFETQAVMLANTVNKKEKPFCTKKKAKF